MSSPLPSRYEFKAISRDGRLLRIEASVSYLRRDERLAVLGVLQDISARKAYEHQLLRNNHELSVTNVVADAITEVQDLGRIIEQVVERLIEVLGVDAAGVSMLDDTKERFASSTLPRHQRDVHSRDAPAQSEQRGARARVQHPQYSDHRRPRDRPAPRVRRCGAGRLSVGGHDPVGQQDARSSRSAADRWRMARRSAERDRGRGPATVFGGRQRLHPPAAPVRRRRHRSVHRGSRARSQSRSRTPACIARRRRASRGCRRCPRSRARSARPWTSRASSGSSATGCSR